MAKRDFPRLISQAWKSCTPHVWVQKSWYCPTEPWMLFLLSLYLPFSVQSSSNSQPTNAEPIDSVVDLLGENIQNEKENLLNLNNCSLSPSFPTESTSVCGSPFSLPPVLPLTPSSLLPPVVSSSTLSRSLPLALFPFNVSSSQTHSLSHFSTSQTSQESSIKDNPNNLRFKTFFSHRPHNALDRGEIELCHVLERV